MTLLEYYKYKKKPCNCNRDLVWYKKEYKKRIRARGHWINDYMQMLTKHSKYKTEHKYIAECEVCGKFYFSTQLKKEMIANLKFLGCNYKKREDNNDAI